MNELEVFAFAYCRALKEIRWPKNTDFTRLQLNPFTGCVSLERISIPTTINFEMPDNLKEVEIHEDLRGISQNCFYYENTELEDKLYSNKGTIPLLLKNPNYKLIDGFMVNTKHKIALFYAERNKKEVRIPDGIETISTYCFDEYGYFRRDFHENAYFGTTLIPVEKVIIPKSVKTLYSSAFCYCDNLTSAIYEGKSSDLKIKSNPFKDCKNFTWFDSKILCSDTPKTNEKKTPGMRFERLILIHRAIASGSYPNSENLRQLCKRKLGLRGLGLSTISRDIEFLRNRFYAPIEYDHIKRGYFYSEDFSLNFDADGINTREEFMRSLG